MSSRTSTLQALVLKRSNVGEANRLVTILTAERGKLTCVAKGVRKLSSSQRAFLEPGNHVSLLLVETKSLPLLTQTRLINDFSATKKSLTSIKKLQEVLEIVDRLFPEDVEEQELFESILSIVEELEKKTSSFQFIQQKLSFVVTQLGYQDMNETKYTSILDYVSSIAERPLRSYEFLSVKKN